ncbi:hypothetical protein M378DRAFT_10848 [Amanita muscaria Koide BX008]|uniref:Uncharacterized protein n=1 Tax=Amanita muscaria (strain Koide BX008) TaxID=946122 RepID=A0A0C2WUM7_AMAMK|nr:hypothetical protein M378DRAFT_10848 [Amanita muscaria Koide BX008]
MDAIKLALGLRTVLMWLIRLREGQEGLTKSFISDYRRFWRGRRLPVGWEEYNFDIFYAPHPDVVITPVDPVVVNWNPQRLVDADPDGNIVNIVNEAGGTAAKTAAVNKLLGRLRKRSATETAIRAARAAKAILRNSEARTHEDLDWLHKAQVVYMFVELGILEFDPALRMECQCMAVQERERREEHRKSRDNLLEKEDTAQL